MSLLLCIDTATEIATVCLTQNGKVLIKDTNDRHKDHAAWLHPAINSLLDRSGLVFQDLQAIAVSIGPGSYTGLRIGLSAAKGYCFALKIPLLTIGTLEIMANSLVESAMDLVCPLLDARRMEVFAAVYNKKLIEIISPLAMILQANSFESLLATQKILFCGSGSNKLKAILSDPNASFSETGDLAVSFSALAEECFQRKKFAELAYSEPLYLKEFHSSASRNE